VVIFIDDLQWGDADSAEALFELLKPPGESALPVLGAYRSDEMEESRFLQHYRVLQARSADTPPAVEIEVGKLTVSREPDMTMIIGQDLTHADDISDAIITG